MAFKTSFNSRDSWPPLTLSRHSSSLSVPRRKYWIGEWCDNTQLITWLAVFSPRDHFVRPPLFSQCEILNRAFKNKIIYRLVGVLMCSLFMLAKFQRFSSFYKKNIFLHNLVLFHADDILIWQFIIQVLFSFSELLFSVVDIVYCTWLRKTQLV